MKRKYEIFIPGETVDLVLPNKNAIEQDNWHSWFNDRQHKFLIHHGSFPNTKEDQYHRLSKMIEMNKNKEGLFLLIKPKSTNEVIGVTSLSVISWIFNSAYLSVVIGSRKKSKDFFFWSFETKALMTSHAFEELGLQRIHGSQAFDLKEWQKYSILLGFYPEGIQRRSIKKGKNFYDVIIHSCLYEDYLKIKKINQGSYWPGKKKFFDLIKCFPNDDIYTKIKEFNKQISESLIKKIYKK